MSRSERLMQILEQLRLQPYGLRAQDLASSMNVSLRSIYRDVATLQAQGVPIEGEAGIGYVLRSGYFLPPLTFTTDEIESLVLGIRWVLEHGDSSLKEGAQSSLARIKSVLPEHLQKQIAASTLLIPSEEKPLINDHLMLRLRQIIQKERKLNILYRDLKDQESQRCIWPFAIAYFRNAYILMAWCEERADYRHFRIDRIQSLGYLGEKYPKTKADLLRTWQEKIGIDVNKYKLF
ncbi:helix-turn-helix transcriptional regulator [Spirochaeta cellobiosiphila]|uniref:helix-turn-helix transcriptional regulator n=1 Tax=Spirochaeta cellobiosiphila TaxID=504483 RepID=UPI000410C4FD|nr:YafY family protein [Spirochaeta cellobiosiphila]